MMQHVNEHVTGGVVRHLVVVKTPRFVTNSCSGLHGTHMGGSQSWIVNKNGVDH